MFKKDKLKNKARSLERALDVSFPAYNDSIWEYHEKFGYSYVKNKIFLHLSINNGLPAFWREAYINKYGNQGKIKNGYDSNKYRILIFGDSFTAYFHDGITWPCLLQNKLDDKDCSDIQIMNFGRDGYGILQMFDLAASKTRELRPDFSIITFITDDLKRDRFWRTCQIINGLKRVFTTTRAAEMVYPESSVDIAVLNNRISKEWCQYMVDTKNVKDPLFMELMEQYLYLRELSRDGISGNPTHDYETFFDDDQMVDKISELNELETPYCLMHLPTYSDFKNEKYIMDYREKRLLDSLQELTGKKIISMLQNGMNDFPGLEEYYLLPYDPHLSMKGLDLYSDLVLNTIREYKLL